MKWTQSVVGIHRTEALGFTDHGCTVWFFKVLTLPLDGMEIVSELKDEASNKCVLDFLVSRFLEGRAWKRTY